MGDGAPVEMKLAVKFAAVSLLGFAVDAGLLQLGTTLGLQAAWARLISLICAMQVTFAINSMHVFRERDRDLPQQWTRYMLSNGFGNFCNYWIFVTLVSLHWAIASNHLVALCCAAFVAWMMNFASARFWVFRRRRIVAPLTPVAAPAADALAPRARQAQVDAV
jgi:putative flippase GtrA